MSAGDHAKAVARHAALLGIRAVIVMPAFTLTTKVTRTTRWGA
jgi:threonine dehydratase